jgi:predicted amidohydrolase
MKIVLMPLQLSSGDSGAAVRAMTHSVERYHSEADLIVLPQIEVTGASPITDPALRNLVSPLHVQSDIAAALARRRNVYLAGGFWETRESDHYAMLALADRTGQVAVRTRRLSSEPTPDNLGLSLLTARIATFRAGICLSDDLFEPSLVDAVNSLILKFLAVPVYLVAPPSEEGDAESTLSAVAELRTQLGEVARHTRTYVVAVNSLSGEPGLGSCGGAWVYGPSGQVVAERDLYDDTPLEFEI